MKMIDWNGLETDLLVFRHHLEMAELQFTHRDIDALCFELRSLNAKMGNLEDKLQQRLRGKGTEVA